MALLGHSFRSARENHASKDGKNFFMIPKILSQVTVKEWYTNVVGHVSFRTSGFCELPLENALLTALNQMKTNAVSILEFVTKDRTQIMAELCFGDILRFMVENYSGDLNPFKKLLNEEPDSFHFLKRADESDSLLNVLTIMRD